MAWSHIGGLCFFPVWLAGSHLLSGRGWPRGSAVIFQHWILYSKLWVWFKKKKICGRSECTDVEGCPWHIVECKKATCGTVCVSRIRRIHSDLILNNWRSRGKDFHFIYIPWNYVLFTSMAFIIFDEKQAGSQWCCGSLNGLCGEQPGTISGVRPGAPVPHAPHGSSWRALRGGCPLGWACAFWFLIPASSTHLLSRPDSTGILVSSLCFKI